jgi:CRP-like cAMP-binding protein
MAGAAALAVADAVREGAQRVRMAPGQSPMLDRTVAGYLLESGVAHQFYEHQGRRRGIRCLGAGTLFGWPAKVGAATSAVCITEVYAIQLTRSVLQESKLPTSLRRLVWLDGQRALEEVSQNLVSATSDKTDQRLASWLAQSFEQAGQHELRATHAHFAELLGVRRASVTVALHALEGERAIKNFRGRVVLLDEKRLRKVALGETRPEIGRTYLDVA